MDTFSRLRFNGVCSGWGLGSEPRRSRLALRARSLCSRVSRSSDTESEIGVCGFKVAR